VDQDQVRLKQLNESFGLSNQSLHSRRKGNCKGDFGKHKVRTKFSNKQIFYFIPRNGQQSTHPEECPFKQKIDLMKKEAPISSYFS
jgi:hypothetical protein